MGWHLCGCAEVGAKPGKYDIRTTVRQDFGEMGRRAFEALVTKVANPSAEAVRGVIPVELVRRESVASTI